MPKQMAGELKPGEPVDSDFLVARCSLRSTRTGGTYLDLLLADKTGQISGRMWDATEALAASIKVDDFVHIKGRAESYQNNIQITARSITQAPTDSLRLGDFLPQSPFDVAQMFKEFKELLDTVKDPPLRALLDAFLADKEFCDAFRTCPAATANHHAHLGGLLEHTLSMAKLAAKLAEHYPELRGDLLMTGVFLHDIGKTRELSYRRTFQYTTPGNLVGHIMLGVLMLEDEVRKLPEFPVAKLNMLRHMILSHHGQLEFGSPKLPMFAEAMALHYLDNLDAKLKDFSELVAEDRSSDPEWTEYHPRLARKLYKG